MKKLLVHFVLLFCFCSSSAAQGKDTLNWFPYKAGDMWEYWTSDGVTVDTLQSFNIKDSVSTDGKIHLTKQSRLINPIEYGSLFKYIIDTTTAEVIGPSRERMEVLVYRFNVKKGDKWVMYDYGSDGFRYEMARVKEIYKDLIFGKETTFLVMHYYLAEDSTDTLGLDRYRDTMAKGFGLVERSSAEGPFQTILKGAIIDGTLYGDTTKIITSIPDGADDVLPTRFELHQNYPNPFNPVTTIRYSVPTKSFVKIVLYDMLGREVRTLVEGIKNVGSHSVVLNSAELSNGVYFYRLMSERYTNVKKMLVIK